MKFFYILFIFNIRVRVIYIDLHLRKQLRYRNLLKNFLQAKIASKTLILYNFL